MINSKRLVDMFRKWQKVAAKGRRRIAISRTGETRDMKFCNSSVADKGHFVVYTVDGRRFMVPLQYLKTPVFVELFRMSEDAFGLKCNGPITLPCDGAFVEQLMGLIMRRRVSEEVERALVLSIANRRCSDSAMLRQHKRQSNQQMLIHGF